MKLDPEIISANRDIGLAVDEAGQTWRVTDWMDADGQNCGPDEAVSCVARRDRQWIAIDLTKFEQAVIN